MSADQVKKDPSKALPPGFFLHEHEYYDSWGTLYRMPIALPQPLFSVLEHERKQRCFERNERDRVAEAERRAVAEKRHALDAALAGTGNIARSSPPPRMPSRPRGTVAVFDWTSAWERLELLRTRPDSPDKQLIKRDIGLFEQAMKPGPWRRVALPRGWRLSLETLAAEMPHFSNVLTFIAQRLALAELTRAPLQPAPILLLGSPGVGKTYFAQRLAEFLDAPVHRESFDNVEHSGGLRGSDRHWANTSNGALFQLIVAGQHANPIVLLDEIDKARVSANAGNPLDALLTVLEPVTNSRVTDQSVKFEFDASYVWYIATANDANRIGAPVRSRFVEFTIEEPDIEGRLSLAHAIYAGTLARLVQSRTQRARFRPLTNLQVCQLAWLTPRQMRMAVESALGAAALARRWHIEDADLNAASFGAGRTAAAEWKGRRPGDEPGDAFAIVVLPH